LWGCSGGPGHRGGASTALAQIFQTAVVSYPIQPGAHGRALPARLQRLPRGQECLLHRVLGVLHLAEDPIAVQLQLAPVGVRERRERLMVARTGTDQSAVVHERSLASRLTTTATPPMLEIRRRVSPQGGVRTRDRQVRVLIGASNAASRSRSSARHRSHRGATSCGRSEAGDPLRPSRRARATRGGHSNRGAAIRVDSAAWTPCASGRRHVTNRDSSSGRHPFLHEVMSRRVSRLVAGWRTGLSRPCSSFKGETPSTTLAHTGCGRRIGLCSPRLIASR
jgi:hypothetical protein